MPTKMAFTYQDGGRLQRWQSSKQLANEKSSIGGGRGWGVSHLLDAGPRWCSGYITHLSLNRTGLDSRRGCSWIFVGGNRAGRCRWLASLLGISRFPCPFIPALLHTHLNSLQSALKTAKFQTALQGTELVLGGWEEVGGGGGLEGDLTRQAGSQAVLHSTKTANKPCVVSSSPKQLTALPASSEPHKKYRGVAVWQTPPTRAVIAEISYEIANHRNPLHRPVNWDDAADIGQCLLSLCHWNEDH
ncbi:hypothetical protein PR048_025191 [Dryococelus australis]|uniref:Uncharacterized protein n=1 Tax=Dryococelus australis TaxID=614101 RepID=A0ABQ9GQL4_9NEOP|nr:hypothetical protein PR048_025191 [Dryococelus australis]